MNRSMATLLETLPDAHPDIRYVAVYDGRELASWQREGITGASAGESDRYEELLVNPTLLKLIGQRGDIDCGGLEFVMIRYGHFWELVLPMGAGHLSVGVQPGADPLRVLDAVRTAAVRAAGALPAVPLP